MIHITRILLNRNFYMFGFLTFKMIAFAAKELILRYRSSRILFDRDAHHVKFVFKVQVTDFLLYRDWRKKIKLSKIGHFFDSQIDYAELVELAETI